MHRSSCTRRESLGIFIAFVLLFAACAPAAEPTPQPTFALSPTPAPTLVPTATSMPKPTDTRTATPMPTDTPTPTETPVPWKVVLTFYSADKPGNFSNPSARYKQEMVPNGHVVVNGELQFNVRFDINDADSSTDASNGLVFDNGAPDGPTLRRLYFVYQGGRWNIGGTVQNKNFYERVLNTSNRAGQFAIRIAADGKTATFIYDNGQKKLVSLPDSLYDGKDMYLKIQTAPKSSVTVYELAFAIPLGENNNVALVIPTATPTRRPPTATPTPNAPPPLDFVGETPQYRSMIEQLKQSAVTNFAGIDLISRPGKGRQMPYFGPFEFW